jgi:protein ImuB
MPRIVCVWAPFWGFRDQRSESRRQTSDVRKQNGHPLQVGGTQDEPRAFVRTQASARRLWTLNPAARALGLVPGQALADAQAIAPELQYADADPAGDQAALERTALWALRYSPWVHARLEEDGTGVLLIDIQGSEHLFGGEQALMRDIAARMGARGVETRIAAADSIGAAHALARYGGAALTSVERTQLREGLARLPVEALRIGPVAEALRRAGLKTIGEVLRIARQPLTARFGAHLPLRLDQALARAPEPLNPLIPPLSHRAQLTFLEPVASTEGVMIAVARAAGDLAQALAARGLGARRLRLTLHRTDGAIVQMEAGCAAPSHDGAHLTRLFKERFKAAEDETDLGLGIEGLTLEAQAEAAPARQTLLESGAEESERELDALIDRLGSRLTLARVQRLDPNASHLPERAVVARPAAQGGGHPGWEDFAPGPERPLLMLPAAEPAEVIAEIPDGPPKRFRWRKTLYEAARAEGPERIAPEWWRLDSRAQTTRDYYRVEDAAGRRFWLYRDGLFGEADAAPRWFVHGVFA